MRAAEAGSPPILSPVRAFLWILLIIFLAEAFVMVLLPRLVPLEAAAALPLVDAVLLVVLAGPLLWWAVVRPLRSRALAEHLRAATVIRHVPDGVVTLDNEGRVQWLNPAFAQIFGYTPAELIGQGVERLVPTRYREAHEEGFRRVAMGGVPRILGRTVEYAGCRKDGLEIPVELSVTRWEADGEQFFTGIVRDISDRKRAEVALERRTQQLEAVRVVSEDLTRELDLTALLALIDRRAAELLGAGSGVVWLWNDAQQELALATWHGHGDWVRGRRMRLGEGLAGTVARRREGLLVNDYPGSPYAHPDVLAHAPVTAALAQPLLYRGELLGVITLDNLGSDRGFTEPDLELLGLFATQAATAIQNARLYEQVRQHANELEARVEARTAELAVANQQLRDASRHKSEFLASMSHEIRTPLNSIIGFADLLIAQGVGPLNPRQQRFLTNILRSGQHLLQLINDILDLSKVEAGKFVLTPEPLAVGEVLEDVLVIARGLANKKGQAILTEIPDRLPLLAADPVRFKQIFFNLLSNAVKFTPEGGTITLRARSVPGARDRGPGTGDPSPEPPCVEISVLDTGVGIRAEDLPKLFGEFVQLDTTQAQHHEGSGLGLALTRRLVELHGGRIRAESGGEGQGSCFTVRLPTRNPAARDEA